ncbi:MAG: hypothetical protein ACRELD_02185 [Longimicrobiales bacterium]
MRHLWRALSGASAVTDPKSDDPRLRGRTYAVPFEGVWQAARGLAAGQLRGWRVVEADDNEGVILARVARLGGRTPDEIRIRITLDQNGQTRVDAFARAPGARSDLGRSARRLGSFFRRLDRALSSAGSRATPPPRVVA